MKAVLSCTDKEAALQGVHVPRFACRHLPNLEPLACSYANEGHAEIHPVKPAGCMSLAAPAGHRKQMSLAVLKEGEMPCKVSSSLPDTHWQCEQKPAGYRDGLEGLRGSTGRTGMFLSPFWCKTERVALFTCQPALAPLQQALRTWAVRGRGHVEGKKGREQRAPR